MLRELHRFVPRRFSSYHEPFLGSAALFFDLWQRGILDGRSCRLTDVNPDLVGCYQALARGVDSVVGELYALSRAHARNPSAAYYRVRDELFNPRRRALAGRTDRPEYPADLAAMLIYLNRTGYNGLFRLNAKGDFNVPAGRYTRPRICDESTLRAVAEVLSAPGVEIRREPFAGVGDAAGPGDLVYLDPPYAPLSPTARFTSYTPGSFSEEDQRRLHRVVVDLVRRGCHVVLSNSTAPLVSELYDTRAARAAGIRAYRVPAKRAINSKASARGAVEEYIITNVDPDQAGPIAST